MRRRTDLPTTRMSAELHLFKSFRLVLVRTVLGRSSHHTSDSFDTSRYPRFEKVSFSRQPFTGHRGFVFTLGAHAPLATWRSKTCTEDCSSFASQGRAMSQSGHTITRRSWQEKGFQKKAGHEDVQISEHSLNPSRCLTIWLHIK